MLLLAGQSELKYKMNTYHGSCHCGLIKFQITTDIGKAVTCTCSICKKGDLRHQVTPEQFSQVEGTQYLTLYQFDTKEVKNDFYSACGIHPLKKPYSAPGLLKSTIQIISGNVRRHIMCKF